MGQSKSRECWSCAGREKPVEEVKEEKEILGETNQSQTTNQQTNYHTSLAQQQSQQSKQHQQQQLRQQHHLSTTQQQSDHDDASFLFKSNNISSHSNSLSSPPPPHYHVHVNVNVNEGSAASREPCELCLRYNRHPPSLIESDVCMCSHCWDESSEETRQVVRHRNGQHDSCPLDYPLAELLLLPDQTPTILAHWRAEWRHAHDRHEYCQPHYLFGCTHEEEQAAELLQRHQDGDHCTCPPEFPELMMKLTGEEEGEAEELSEETKAMWRAAWKHEHNDHTACGPFDFECTQPVMPPIRYEGLSMTSPGSKEQLSPGSAEHAQRR